MKQEAEEKKEKQSDERREGVREEEGKSLSLTGV